MVKAAERRCTAKALAEKALAGDITNTSAECIRIADENSGIIWEDPGLETEKRKQERARRTVAAVRQIERMKESCGRLGYEIGADFYDDDPGVSYGDIGGDIIDLVHRYPEHADLIEDVVIAVCGYGFETLKERMKEHKSYWDAL